jgi:hypothetical protein
VTVGMTPMASSAMTIRRTVIEAVEGDHRTLAYIVRCGSPYGSPRARARTLGMTVRTVAGVVFLSSLRSPREAV